MGWAFLLLHSLLTYRVRCPGSHSPTPSRSNLAKVPSFWYDVRTISREEQSV